MASVTRSTINGKATFTFTLDEDEFDEDPIVTAQDGDPDLERFTAMMAAWYAQRRHGYAVENADSDGGQRKKPRLGDVHEDVRTTKRTHAEVASTTSPVKDGSTRWRKSFKTCAIPVQDYPVSEALASAITVPLHPRIGLTKTQMERVRAQASAQVCDKLFVEDDFAPCSELWENVFLRVLKPTHCCGPTGEREFHHAWSVLVRHVVATVIGDNCNFTRREQNDPDSSDFAVEMHGVGVFQGQERVPLPPPHESIIEEMLPEDSIVVARRELCDKLIWTYGEKVPYIIGYAASGYKCELYTLHTSDYKKVERTLIGSYGLEYAEDRLQLVLALLHLCQLFPAIVKLCSPQSRLELAEVTRPDGVILKLAPTQVTRDYSKVRDDYKGLPMNELLTANQVFWINSRRLPKMEFIQTIDLSNLEFTFKPRGFEVFPQSLDELFHAIECVLTALVAIHSRGWMHRDIQWSNVLQYRNPADGWFLTDFVHAARYPQDFPRDTHLCRDNHAPEMLESGQQHTSAVDVWSVGRLISMWEVESELPWTSDHARAQFLDKLSAFEPIERPTAANALLELKALRARARESATAEGV